MARAAAEGVNEEGGEAILKQTAELMPEQYWDENVKKAKESMKDILVADPRKDLNGFVELISKVLSNQNLMKLLIFSSFGEACIYGAMTNSYL